NTRASLVCFKKQSRVGRASSGKWSVSVRIMVVSRIKYYKNVNTSRHPTGFSYYKSTAFPTQIFRDLLVVEQCGHPTGFVEQILSSCTGGHPGAAPQCRKSPVCQTGLYILFS